MKKQHIDWLWEALRWSLGVVFVAASFYKIVSPVSFAHQIYNYKILPVWAINPVALTLPFIQLLCGLALLANKGTRGAAFLLSLMMAAFQAAVASALVRGLNISCGCFKSGGSPATWLTVLRDFGIFAGCVAVFWKSLRKDGPIGSR